MVAAQSAPRKALSAPTTPPKKEEKLAEAERTSEKVAPAPAPPVEEAMPALPPSVSRQMAENRQLRAVPARVRC
jgi:hypothetical protein